MALYDTKTYGSDIGDHRIEFEFDRTGVIVNRGRLYVDGRELDKRAVFWGDSSVRGHLPDGRAFEVVFGSGFVGQLTHLELRIDGEVIDLKALGPVPAR